MARNLLALILVVGLLNACGGGGSSSPDAAASTTSGSNAAATVGAAAVAPVKASVTAVTKVSEARVARTVFDYGFRITVQNGGAQALTGVEVTLTAVGSGSTIVIGNVLVGDLAPNGSARPHGTIVIRHDRTVPFDMNAFKWAATGTVATTPPSTPGVLLTGNPAADAAQALVDFDAPRTVFDSEYVRDPATGSEYQRTQILVTLHQGATVGAVNAALQAAGARIVFMRRGGLALTLQVPDPGSLMSLTALANMLASSGAFDSAVPSRNVTSEARLPSKLTPDDAQKACGAVVNHAAVKLPAAWNAVPQGFTSSEVGVIVVDYFGATTTTDKLQTCGPIKPASHGWHVEGTALANHNGASKVTGASAVPLRLQSHRIDLSAKPPNSGPDLEWIAKELEKVFRTAPTKKFVVNFSLWIANPANRVGVESFGDYWRRAALWAGGSLSKGYEGQVIQVSAAGNDGSAAANSVSVFNRAALGPLPAGASPLTNGIIVENRRAIAGTDTSAATVGCRNTGSSFNGTLGAVGTDVLSDISSTDSGYMSGTSMASPQVAGTAAMMLSIASKRTVGDVISALLDNAIPNADSCRSISAAPSMDAYAAVLALDEVSGLDTTDDQVRGATVPARLAILHPAGNAGRFTVADFSTLVDALFAPLPNPSPVYTQYDLNGDGFVGDAREARFNLDMNSEPQRPLKSKFESPPRTAILPPNGIALNKASGNQLDENLATDFEILCYYAGSALFEGAPAEVASILQAKSVALGRISNPISCARPTEALVNVKTTNPGWIGLPATIELSGLAPMNILQFQIQGDPGNTCGSGERGGPIYSASVDPTALFFSVTTVIGLPQNVGGAGINRRPCSSFVARKSYSPALREQVWINATGRGQTFGATSFDWEIQVRYSNGDPRGPTVGLGAQCQVGVVPNIGLFIPSFDAQCDHQIGVTRIVQ